MQQNDKSHGLHGVVPAIPKRLQNRSLLHIEGSLNGIQNVQIAFCNIVISGIPAALEIDHYLRWLGALFPV